MHFANCFLRKIPLSAGAQVGVRGTPYPVFHWLGSLSRSILSPKPKIPQKNILVPGRGGPFEFPASSGLILQNYFFFLCVFLWKHVFLSAGPMARAEKNLYMSAILTGSSFIYYFA